MEKNKKRMLFFALLALFLFNSFSAYAENKADEYLNRAISKYLQDDLKGAIGELREALKLDPLHPKAKKLLLAVMEEEKSLEEKIPRELVLPGEYKTILNTIQNSLKETSERMKSLEGELKKTKEEKETAVLALAQTRAEFNTLKKKIERQESWRKRLEDEVAIFKSEVRELRKERGEKEIWNPSLDNITQGNPAFGEVAITFDAHSYSSTAEEILQVLKKEGVTSTFFLTGRFIDEKPALVRRIVIEGHEVANHTNTHPHLTTYEKNRRQRTLPSLKESSLRRELKRTAGKFFSLTGKEMAPYWRAPYGEHNSEIRKWAKNSGYLHVHWTNGRNWREGLDTMDWLANPNSQGYTSSEETKKRILKNVSNGSIILMHLGTKRKKDPIHNKLEEMVEELRLKGYKLVTISELIDNN
jgi:peptidoglycan/xylan/chitin deacetylase (PgdA/CDA1 family)